MTWDAGRSTWATPFGHHAPGAAGAAAAAVAGPSGTVGSKGNASRDDSGKVVSGGAGGAGGAAGGGAAAAAADLGDVAGVYHLVMTLPRAGAFGPLSRLVFELRTASGQWLRAGSSGASFVLPLDDGHDAAVAAVAAAAAAKDAAAAAAAGEKEQKKAPASPATAAAEAAPAAAVAAETAASPSAASGLPATAAAPLDTTVRPAPWDAAAAAAAEAAWDVRSLLRAGDAAEEAPALGPVPRAVVAQIAGLEAKAERSLMHRFSIAADLLREHCGALLEEPAATGGDAEQQQQQQQQRRADAAAALGAVALWLRLSALRLLRWNVNYNVKPREISAASDALGGALAAILSAAAQPPPPSARGAALLALVAAGRGGEGGAGQRVRDEILAIQHRTGLKGGMVEQWHQKLHNNSSPDDVVICRALLAYVRSGRDEAAYWRALEAGGVTRQRLASFDRAITHAPAFTAGEEGGSRGGCGGGGVQ